MKNLQVSSYTNFSKMVLSHMQYGNGWNIQMIPIKNKWFYKMRRRKNMSSLMLFVILLIVGAGCFGLRKKSEGKIKVILTIVGVVICIFAVFGLFTAFL